MEFAPPPEGYLNTRQICELLGITKPTLYQWMRHGLPSHKPMGRRLYIPSEVQAWIKSRCTSPAPDQTAVS